MLRSLLTRALNSSLFVQESPYACYRPCANSSNLTVPSNQADFENKDSLRKALHGAYAVYAVTNYWEKMDGKLELQQGKNVADVAKVDLPLEKRFSPTKSSVLGLNLSYRKLACSTSFGAVSSTSTNVRRSTPPT